MERIKVIVLDADNCIFLDEGTREGSEEIKDRAWFEVFAEYDRDMLGSVIDRVKEEIVGGTGDRKDIVRRVLEHFNFSQADISNEVERRCDQFDHIVQAQISSIPISADTRSALKNLYSMLPLYINTATPKDAIIKTLRILELDFFKDIYGRPGTKTENLQKIIEVEDILPSEILFVGDMQSDYEAAKEVGCRFVGVRTKRNSEWEKQQTFPLIDSVSELENLE